MQIVQGNVCKHSNKITTNIDGRNGEDVSSFSQKCCTISMRMTIDPNATINSLVSMQSCKHLIEAQSFVEQKTLIKKTS
jgi:hypothetical protein